MSLHCECLMRDCVECTIKELKSSMTGGIQVSTAPIQEILKETFPFDEQEDCFLFMMAVIQRLNSNIINELFVTLKFFIGCSNGSCYSNGFIEEKTSKEPFLSLAVNKLKSIQECVNEHLNTNHINVTCEDCGIKKNVANATLHCSKFIIVHLKINKSSIDQFQHSFESSKVITIGTEKFNLVLEIYHVGSSMAGGHFYGNI